jgi:glycolate oxidase iron-sulfur subunit
VRDEPRALLGAIDGVTLVPLTDGDLCCGSAGIYNLEHPAVAATLGARKAHAVLAADVDVVATGNAGCMNQMRTHLARAAPERPVPVIHTVELLDRAYQGAAESGTPLAS